MTWLDLALVWGILNFLPVIGNIVGIVPPVRFALLQFDGGRCPRWCWPASSFCN